MSCVLPACHVCQDFSLDSSICMNFGTSRRSLLSLAPDASFCWMPPRVTGPPVLNLVAPLTLSRVNPMNHYPATLCMQGSASISISFCSQKPQLWGTLQLTLLDCTQLPCPENPSLTTRIVAGCSLPYPAPGLSAAVLTSLHTGMCKGSTPRNELRELSLPFSPSFACPGPGSQGRSCLR